MTLEDADFDDFRDVVFAICDKAAEAVLRYHELTDWDPKWVPESFIQCYILDQLGKRISLNLEIPVPLLWTWIGGEAVAPPNLGKEVVDFVINKNDNLKKSLQHIWGLAELKRHNDVRSDRYKLDQILPHFKSCRFGVAIGVAGLTDQGWLDQEARKEGRRLVRSLPKMQKFDGSERAFFGFGFIHINTAFAGTN